MMDFVLISYYYNRVYRNNLTTNASCDHVKNRPKYTETRAQNAYRKMVASADHLPENESTLAEIS